MTLTAIGSFGLGQAIGLHGYRVNRNSVGFDRTLHSRAVLYWDGVGLLIASIVFLVFAILSFGNLLSYSRVDFFRTDNDTRGFGVFLMIFPSAITALVLGSTTKHRMLLSSGIAILALGIILLSGYRSAAMFSLLVGAVVWVKTGHRLPLSVAGILIGGTFLAIPIIGDLRSQGPYETISIEALQKSASDAQPDNAIRTMGQTLAVLGHVIRLVPKEDPYQYGMTYLRTFPRAIPNIGFRMTSSERAEALSDGSLTKDAVLSISPSSWITYRIAYDKFIRGEGVGFTAVGEPYLNFGVAGVIIVFVLLGFLLGRLDTLDLFAHPNWLVFASTVLWSLVRTVRNDFGGFVKPFVFTVIIIVLWRLLSSMLGIRQRFLINTVRQGSRGRKRAVSSEATIAGGEK